MDRAASSMDFRFEDPFIIPGTRTWEEVWLEWRRVTEGWLRAWKERGVRARQTGAKEANTRERERGLEALEETKGVFSPR